MAPVFCSASPYCNRCCTGVPDSKRLLSAAASRVNCRALPPGENKRFQQRAASAFDLAPALRVADSASFPVPRADGLFITSVNSRPPLTDQPLTRTTQTRTRVAVDVDEVLGSFLYSLNLFCREQYALNFEISDYRVYDFAKVWKRTQVESNVIVHEFFNSQRFAAGIPPIPGALDSLRRLSETYELMVVTSRQHCIRQPTLDWLELHYPGVFTEVHFGNHYALEGTSRKKSEICKEIGASVLIDDNPYYALDCARSGVHVLLFDQDNSYPWSKTQCGPTHPLITRVPDWPTVEQQLMLLPSQHLS